jgi:putative monooxygenase ydhR
MENAESVLSVKFNSAWDSEKLLNICMQDLEDFRNVPGLLQKYYISEDETGAISGIYIFKDRKAKEDFWQSALAKSIPARYGVIPETLRVEQYEMAIVLNDVIFSE